MNLRQPSLLIHSLLWYHADHPLWSVVTEFVLTPYTELNACCNKYEMAFKDIFFFLAATLLTTGLAENHVNGTSMLPFPTTNTTTAMSGFVTLVAAKTLDPPASSVDKRSVIVVASLEPGSGMETLFMRLGDKYGKKKKVPTVKQSYPAKDLPLSPRKSCVRMALAAVAKWRKICCRYGNKHWELPKYCEWAPGVERCCVENIPYNEPDYLDHPTFKRRVMTLTPESASDQTYPWTIDYIDMVAPSNLTRMIVERNATSFKTRGLKLDKRPCEVFGPQFEKEYRFWMWKLKEFGIDDADEDGKCFGMDKWGPDALVHKTNLYIDRDVCGPVWYKHGPENFVDTERAIVKSGWHW